MKTEWKRTSFRIKREAREALADLSKRSGLKIKELLDDVIRSSSESGIWGETSEELSDEYRKMCELEDAERVTFEVTAASLKALEKVVSGHRDLSRDQILNIMVLTRNWALSFPLKAERRVLKKKIRPNVTRLRGIAKQIERELTRHFDGDHVVYLIMDWKRFSESLEVMSKGIEKWSQERISVPKPGELPRRTL